MGQQVNNSYSIPRNFRPLYSAEQIQSRVVELGREITAWASDVWTRSHTELLTIPILRGGIFFFADLVRHIPLSVEISPARAWAYHVSDDETSKKNAPLDGVEVDISSVPASGRSILLIDDVCDSGRSLAAMTRALLNAGAAEVKAAVLIRRVVAQQAFTPHWNGFVYPGAEWFVGYGLDDGDRFRNLPGVYIIGNAS